MSDFLLLETGDYLEQENGDKIILVFVAPTPSAVTTKKKNSAAWFDIPKMRKDLAPQKEKIYLNELVQQLR